MPSPLAAALQDDEQAKAAFERLSYTHRRDCAEWIAEAKRDDTRARRVAETLARLPYGSP